MRAYLVVTADSAKSREVAQAIAALPGVRMADACWGVGDVYAVLEFENWKDLNALVLDKVHHMAGVNRTETHVAISE